MGTLRCVDCDTVEPSNLTRQLLYAETARNLHDDASVYLLTRGTAALRWLRRERIEAAKPEITDEREYRLVRYYAWLMLIGSAASGLALVAFV